MNDSAVCLAAAFLLVLVGLAGLMVYVLGLWAYQLWVAYA